MRHLLSAIILIAGIIGLTRPSAAAIVKATQQLVQDRLLLKDDAKLFAPNID